MTKKKTKLVFHPKLVSFGEALLFLMRQRGIGIEDLAAEVEREPITIRAMIEGWAPPPEGLLAADIALVLGVSTRLIEAAAKGAGHGTRGADETSPTNDCG